MKSNSSILKIKEKGILKIYLKVLVWCLQTLALQLQVPSQRHSPCISQSHRLSVPDAASQPHDASVISGSSPTGF